VERHLHTPDEASDRRPETGSDLDLPPPWRLARQAVEVVMADTSTASTASTVESSPYTEINGQKFITISAPVRTIPAPHPR